MDSRQLECFIAVAEELSLGRAAARLHLTQPPLTRRIKRLEREVGAVLFRRSAAGMELTEAGKALLERAHRIVALSDHAIEAAQLARDGTLGRLVIGYHDSAILDGVPQLVRGFVDTYPDVAVRFELATQAEHPDRLRDGRLHVAFGRDYPEQAGLVRRSVLAEPLYVAIPEHRVQEWHAPVGVSDLAAESFVLYPTSRPAFSDRVVGLCLGAGFAPHISVEATDVVSCLAYVALGSAIAIVPRSATRALIHGVAFLELREAAAETLTCVYSTELRPPSLSLFITHLDATMHRRCGPDASPAAPRCVVSS
jgi:DNA-binding transcriptional LysR family regulator